MSYDNSYRFTEDLQESKPEPEAKRVQILIEAYLTAGKKVDKKLNMWYTLETIDIAERLFEARIRERPDTLKVLIHSVYRVKHFDKEFYFFSMTRTIKNKLNNPERPFTYDQYGYHKTPILSLIWNETTNKAEPRLSGYEHGYELSWNKSEVKKMLDSSAIPCEQFFVGNSGVLASDPIATPYYKIQNLTDFLEGSFEDLWNLGRLGLSYPEKSLYLVEPALKQERQNIEKNVGLRDKQGLYA